MSDKTCNYIYEDRYGEHSCKMGKWEKSKDGLCIFHDYKILKSNNGKKLFLKEIKKQLNANGKNKKNFFYGYNFPGYISEESAFFKNIVFETMPHFEDAFFLDYTQFIDVTFKTDISFKNTVFKKGSQIIFKDTKFKKNVYFSKYLDWITFEEETEFYGEVDFKDSLISTLEIRDNNILHDNAFINFLRTKFNNCFITNNTFKGEVRFYHSIFKLKTEINNNKFKNNVYFEGTNFQNTLECKNNEFKNSKNKELVCRKARQTWEEIGIKNKADEYHMLEMIAKRKQKGPSFNFQHCTFKWWFNPKNWLEIPNKLDLKNWEGWRQYFERFFEWILVDRTTAYGTSWLRVLLWWIGIIFGSSLIYTYSGKAFSVGTNEVSLEFGEALYYSTITFATLGYGDITPAIAFTKTVSSIESILGAFFIAAFVLVFGRKFMR